MYKFKTGSTANLYEPCQPIKILASSFEGSTFKHTVNVCMAKLNISVQTTTIGGYRAAVTHITRRPTNQLDGYVHLSAGPASASWSFAGIHAAGDERLNLDMNKPEHQVLKTYPAR